MTLPKLTSTTAELIAYRDCLRDRIRVLQDSGELNRPMWEHLSDMCMAVVDIINRRESCTHEDFTENLEGRKCRTCGLETES